ncbi:MAG: hypothetical protein HRT47_01820 [Candidatus Caenarcaniphilales bacterium]|nr:hypothetical protein [Candidatus Caenarcaniphilales bacterium]
MQNSDKQENILYKLAKLASGPNILLVSSVYYYIAFKYLSYFEESDAFRILTCLILISIATMIYEAATNKDPKVVCNRFAWSNLEKTLAYALIIWALFWGYGFIDRVINPTEKIPVEIKEEEQSNDTQNSVKQEEDKIEEKQWDSNEPVSFENLLAENTEEGVLVTGETNLPDGAILRVGLELKSNWKISTHNSVKIEDGKFEALLCSYQPCRSGLYIVSVLLPMQHDAEIVEILGRLNKKIRGDLVKGNDGDLKTAKKEFDFQLNNSAEDTKLKAKRQLASDLLNKYQNLYNELISFKNQPSFHRLGFSQGSTYASWKARVGELEQEFRDSDIFVPGKKPIIVQPSTLKVLGNSYMRSRGQETSNTLHNRHLFEELFDDKGNILNQFY